MRKNKFLVQNKDAPGSYTINVNKERFVAKRSLGNLISEITKKAVEQAREADVCAHSQANHTPK